MYPPLIQYSTLEEIIRDVELAIILIFVLILNLKTSYSNYEVKSLPYIIPYLKICDRDSSFPPVLVTGCVDA